MVYVNGTPLADALADLGLPPQAGELHNNPVNVTLRANTSFVGSVQVRGTPSKRTHHVLSFSAFHVLLRTKRTFTAPERSVVER